MNAIAVDMDEQCERACRLAVCKYEAFFRGINSIDFDDLMQEARMAGFVALQRFNSDIGSNKAGLVYVAAIYKMNKMATYYRRIKRAGIRFEIEFTPEIMEIASEDSYEQFFIDGVDTIILDVYRAGGITAYSKLYGIPRLKVSKMYREAIAKYISEEH